MSSPRPGSSAAEKWWFTILEWAIDECAYTGVNQTATYAIVDQSMKLRGEFHRVGDNPTNCHRWHVRHHRAGDRRGARQDAAPEPKATAPAGTVLLVVTIKPGNGVGPGGYRGKVVDASTGKTLAKSLFIYVATDAMPVATP